MKLQPLETRSLQQILVGMVVSTLRLCLWSFWVPPTRLISAGLLATALFSCGYEVVHGGESPTQRLSVALADQRSAQLQTAAEVGFALRRELSRHHVLAPGEEYPRVEYEVLRVDERAAAISLPDDSTLPLARGSAISVVVRAWVVEVRGGPRVRDTGDVRRVARFPAQATAAEDRRYYEAAISSAARDAGTAAARRILGEPVPADQAF